MNAFIVSAAGLRNIVLTKDSEDAVEDSFCFIFQEKEIKMNRIFADFISF